MVSATELRTRIADLSSAIKRQKQVLKDLVQQRSDARRDLNAVLDPMARLPLEISSDIFMHCLATTPQPDASAAPMVFLGVCRLWSHIALSSPSLWASLRVDLPRVEEFDKLFEIWLDRARTLPLSISLYGSLDFNPGLCALVHRNAHQVQNLELYLASGEELEQMTTLFPSLRTLTIGQDDNGEDYSYNPRECVEMLCAAPDLVECTFTGIFHRSLFGPPDAESMFTHPCLKHLSLDGRGSVRSGIKILQYLVLPALESLSISYFDIPYDDFLAFLTRSSPPLQSLRMIVQWRRWTGDMLEGILRFVPSLTELYLSEANTSPLLHSPLDVPALVSSELLPKLRRLTISWEDHPPQYAQLVSALHLWRASGKQIPSLRVICSEQNEPDVDIRAALQQFVVDGLDIYIGPES